jgi:hypothetical protein
MDADVLQDSDEGSTLLPISEDIMSMVQYRSSESLHAMELLSSCLSVNRYPSGEALSSVVSYLCEV